MFKRTSVLSLVALTLLVFAHSKSAKAAYEEDADTMNYDSIVNDLKKENDVNDSKNQIRAAQSVKQKTFTSDSLESVWMHLGVGIISPFQNVGLSGGRTAEFRSKGVQAALGIDLLSDHWLAEGTARSFGEASSNDAHIALKEFELKVFYKDHIAKQMNLRMGAGLSGRYMTINDIGGNSHDFVTPSSVATLGLDLILTERMSVGADFSARNAMITDTVDRSSVDATVRLDTHF